MFAVKWIDICTTENQAWLRFGKFYTFIIYSVIIFLNLFKKRPYNTLKLLIIILQQ